MIIPGATPVHEPGGAVIDPNAATQPPRGVSQMSSLVNTLPNDMLDAARIRAREATYPNSQAERAMVDAIDRAAFDKVRIIENQLLAASTNHIERSRGRIKEADALGERIDALTRRVERGESTAALVREYKSITNLAGRLIGQLNDAGRESETWRSKLADPYAHAQKVLSLMPFNSGVRIDPTPYLNR